MIAIKRNYAISVVEVFMYQEDRDLHRDLRQWLVGFAHLESKWQRQEPGERSAILDRELNRLASLILVSIPDIPDSSILVTDAQGRRWALYLDKDWREFAPAYSLAITCYPCIVLADIVIGGSNG